jgi:hypothetical protein
MGRELAVRPCGELGIVDDQAADRREGQDLRAVYHRHQLAALGHDLSGDATEDRLAVLGDAAVDDDEMGDALGHAVGHQARDQAAEAVADQHDISKIVLLQRRHGVGHEHVVVEPGRQLSRALADAAVGQGAGVMPCCRQSLQHELP